MIKFTTKNQIEIFLTEILVFKSNGKILTRPFYASNTPVVECFVVSIS